MEDSEWERRVLTAGWQIVYEPLAMVYHQRDETLAQNYGRSYREGVPLRRLDPSFAQSAARFVVNSRREGLRRRDPAWLIPPGWSPYGPPPRR